MILIIQSGLGVGVASSGGGAFLSATAFPDILQERWPKCWHLQVPPVYVSGYSPYLWGGHRLGSPDSQTLHLLGGCLFPGSELDMHHDDLI